jgi:hypothetical protein
VVVPQRIPNPVVERSACPIPCRRASSATILLRHTPGGDGVDETYVLSPRWFETAGSFGDRATGGRSRQTRGD